LQALDRTIPVVGSPGAIKVAQSLHYQQAIALEHGETYAQLAGVTIKALPGSPIGPQLVENGYLIEDLTSGHKLYYEPHGYHAPSLKQETPIDVAIVPIVDLKLPLLGPIIRGQEQALKLCEWLHPQVIVPTAAGGDVQFSGLLTVLLSSEGEAAAFQKMLADKGLSTEVLDPKPGERIPLNLEPHPASRR
ncbi:MAG: MBL fold metallo-hydrolase, partial [Chloroflexaceae bacterium]|nr:MBL fold metallo-hydrolase [Chloroflexaceae bacterium]